jgi:hypothetical protein
LQRVERPLEIDRIDFVLIDELNEVQGFLRLELYVVEFIVGKQDVFSFRDLVTLDDVVGIDRADTRHDFLVADAFAARLVDLVKADLAR